MALWEKATIVATLRRLAPRWSLSMPLSLLISNFLRQQSINRYLEDSYIPETNFGDQELALDKSSQDSPPPPEGAYRFMTLGSLATGTMHSDDDDTGEDDDGELEDEEAKTQKSSGSGSNNNSSGSSTALLEHSLASLSRSQKLLPESEYNSVVSRIERQIYAHTQQTQALPETPQNNSSTNNNSNANQTNPTTPATPATKIGATPERSERKYVASKASEPKGPFEHPAPRGVKCDSDEQMKLLLKALAALATRFALLSFYS